MNPAIYDWPKLMSELTELLRLKTIPTGMKFLEDKSELSFVPNLEHPPEGELFSACQLMGQATRMGKTISMEPHNIVSNQCRGVLGLVPREEVLKSAHMTGVWFETDEESLKHQAAMHLPPAKYEAVVAFPLMGQEVFTDPDVVMLYASPQQMMLLCNAVQYEKFEVIKMTFVGESSCSDSWGKAMETGKLSITMPCYGERAFGGVLDDEMSAAFPPEYLDVIIRGLKKLKENGMAYPAPYYGSQNDIRGVLKIAYSKHMK